MTSPGELDRASADGNEPQQETHEPPQDTGRQPPGRLPLRRRKTAWLGITLSLLALAGVTAALIAVVAGGGSHQPTSDAASPPPAPGGASAAPGSIKASPVNQGRRSTSKATGTFPSAAQEAASGGALGLPADMRSRVMAWQFGPGGTHLAAVTRLFGDALQAGGERQYWQMRTFCIELAGSVSTAQAGPQIPVVAMQTLYGQALTELANGAVDCRAAITVKPGDESVVTKVMNTALLHRSLSELGLGAREIFRSTAEIEIAGRQYH
jgi:hypothetical protein